MSSRHKQFRKRLAIVEKSLSKRSQRTETPLCVQVQLEAQQELSPEDLQLLNSGNTARTEGRFHSLEEDAVRNKFQELKDVVARRYGFDSYGSLFYRYITSHKSAGKPPKDIAEILHWGRDNCSHLNKLRAALESSKSNSSVSMMDPSVTASSTPSHNPNL
jgi:hypothetical protein